VTQPRVSVALPVLNGMPYLTDAIHSILGQTYRDLELVVVDSGSIDGSAELLRAIDDARVRSVTAPSRLSLPLVHRFIVEATRGTLVAIMGQDDIADPERIARQVELLDARPQVALVGCWCTIIDGTGRTVGRVRYETAWPRLRRGLIRNTQVPLPAMLFRRAAYDRIGGYTDACGYAFDYDLVLRLSRVAEIANVPEELLAIRYIPTGASQSGARAVQRGALRARWLELRRGGRPAWDWLWLLKPLLGLALPVPILRAIILPYMNAVHGRARTARR